MNINNEQMTDGRGSSVTFQNQRIEAGRFLYCFKYNSIIEVVSLLDCSGYFCILFEFKRSEFTLRLSDSNFCTIPSMEEAAAEAEKINSAINSGKFYKTAILYKGNAVTTKPRFESVLAKDNVISIVRTISFADIDSEGFAVSNRFVVTVLTSGGTSTKFAIGLSSFLQVFFTDRANELSKSKIEANKKIDIRKAIIFVLEKQYLQEFENIEGRNEHPFFSFSEWLNENKLF